MFDHITVRDAIAVNDNGRIAWAVQKGNPQLKRAVDSFASTHGKGTLQANVVLNRYLKSTDYVRNSASAEEQRKFRTLVQIFQNYGGSTTSRGCSLPPRATRNPSSIKIDGVPRALWA